MTTLRTRPHPTCCRGLTLLELLAALTILSVFVAAVSAWASGAARLSASASRATEATSALSAINELLRRDLSERPVDPSASSPARGAPRLPYRVLVDPDAGSITLVTASNPISQLDESRETPGTETGDAEGWSTVAWRFDASRGELLRASWPYQRPHTAIPPIALRERSETRVALRGVRSFELVEVDVTHEDDPLATAASATPISVWTAAIVLESGERASIVLAPAPGGPTARANTPAEALAAPRGGAR